MIDYLSFTLTFRSCSALYYLHLPCYCSNSRKGFLWTTCGTDTVVYFFKNIKISSQQVLEEPVAKWQNVGGKNLLVSLVYKVYHLQL